MPKSPSPRCCLACVAVEPHQHQPKNTFSSKTVQLIRRWLICLLGSLAQFINLWFDRSICSLIHNERQKRYVHWRRSNFPPSRINRKILRSLRLGRHVKTNLNPPKSLSNVQINHHHNTKIENNMIWIGRIGSQRHHHHQPCRAAFHGWRTDSQNATISIWAEHHSNTKISLRLHSPAVMYMLFKIYRTKYIGFLCQLHIATCHCYNDISYSIRRYVCYYFPICVRVLLVFTCYAAFARQCDDSFVYCCVLSHVIQLKKSWLIYLFVTQRRKRQHIFYVFYFLSAFLSRFDWERTVSSVWVFLSMVQVEKVSWKDKWPGFRC